MFEFGLDKRTGIIEMFGNDIERYAFIKDGQLCAWKTTIKEESLGSLLINSKQLTKEDQEKCDFRRPRSFHQTRCQYSNLYFLQQKGNTTKQNVPKKGITSTRNFPNM